MTVKESVDEILPSLYELHKSIRRNAAQINDRITTLQTQVVGTSSQYETLQTLHNMRDCVQSAASVVSSASTSTILTTAVGRGDNGTEDFSSEFGDLFPPASNETMLRWVASRSVYDIEEELGDLNNGTELRNEDITHHDDTDLSDSDLELEMFQVLLLRGKQRVAAGDYDGAERDFRNCLSRTSAPHKDGPSISPATHTSRIEILTFLADLYHKQARWTDAESILRQRLALWSHESSSVVLKDTYFLAYVLMKNQAHAEALLYGRRALVGYRKLGEQALPDVGRVLHLLVRICRDGGNADEEEAFSALLSHHKEGRTSENVRHNQGNESNPTPTS